MTVAAPQDDLAPIATLLRCPACQGTLALGDPITCNSCGAGYRREHGVACFAATEADSRQDLADWTEHWGGDNQALASQRFFSWYRQAVFARTVAHYAHKHFPASGVFLEAGCGTSETSIRIDTQAGRRVLVAMDIVPAAAAGAHPIMAVRLAGDAFRMPFATGSLDGIWNVGVMEHFLHDRIDAMVREFRRVLKPGGALIMLWPARTSIPQRMLRATEFFINLRRREAPFRFHPDEISQLRSRAEGRDVLRRNGFEPLEVSGEWRSLHAFKVVVGAVPAG